MMPHTRLHSFSAFRIPARIKIIGQNRQSPDALITPMWSSSITMPINTNTPPEANVHENVLVGTVRISVSLPWPVKSLRLCCSLLARSPCAPCQAPPQSRATGSIIPAPSPLLRAASRPATPNRHPLIGQAPPPRPHTLPSPRRTPPKPPLPAPAGATIRPEAPASLPPPSPAPLSPCPCFPTSSALS